MKRSVGTISATLTALMALIPAAEGAAGGAVAKSDNIRLVRNFPLERARGDLAFDGRFVYAVQRGQDGGLHIFDPSSLKKVGSFKCPTWSDVKPLERGLIAFDVTGPCGDMEFGVAFLDTRDPKRVKFLGGMEDYYFHTFRNYPGKRVVYLSANDCCSDSQGGVERIIDARDPRKPKLGGEYVSYGLGCHDIWIHVSKKRRIAACAAGSETQVWDVSDPFAPVTLSRIPTPQVFFNHSAAISDDGKLLVVGDEAHVVTECVGGPYGDLWIYDISDPTGPVLQGNFSLTRGTPVSSFWVDPENEWCSAHNFEFVPGTRTLVTGWYAGGMNVIDLSDPAQPREIAYYMGDETSVWGAYWVRGRVWTSDADRGVDVFEVKGLKAGR